MLFSVFYIHQVIQILGDRFPYKLVSKKIDCKYERTDHECSVLYSGLISLILFLIMSLSLDFQANILLVYNYEKKKKNEGTVHFHF